LSAITLHNLLSQEVEIYKSFIAFDSTLLLAQVAATTTNDKWKQYVASVSAGLSSPPTQNYIPYQTAQFIVEFAGGTFAIRAIYNFGKLIKSGLSKLGGVGAEATSIEADAEAIGLTEGAAEGGGEAGGEIGAELIGEAAAEAGLDAGLSAALPGIGLIAALGIDALIGLFEGRKEEKALKKAVGEVDDALMKVDEYTRKVTKMRSAIETSSVKEMETFQRLITALTAVASPTFKYDWAPTISNSENYLHAMQSATQQYGILIPVRSDFEAFLQNGGDSWDQFKIIEQTKHPGANITPILNYMRKNLPSAQHLPRLLEIGSPNHGDVKKPGPACVGCTIS